MSSAFNKSENRKAEQILFRGLVSVGEEGCVEKV
jgi:hypothetical protein